MVDKSREESRFRISTQGLKEGYYSPVIYWSGNWNMEPYEEFDFGCRNYTSDSIKISFNMKSDSLGALDFTSGSYAALQKADGGITGSKIDRYGFEIPGRFEGTVKIPFYLLKQAGGRQLGHEDIVGKVTFLGFTVSCRQGQKWDFGISHVSFLPRETTLPDTTTAESVIVGDDSVTRPSVGNIFVNYSVKSFDMLGNATNPSTVFQLKDQVDGIEVSHDGKLIVSPKANQSSFMLVANTKDGQALQKQVQIKNSWTASYKTQKGYDISIPKLFEVPQISTNSGFFYSRKVLYGIRGILIAVSVAFFLFYLSKRHPEIRMFRQIKLCFPSFRHPKK